MRRVGRMAGLAWVPWWALVLALGSGCGASPSTGVGEGAPSHSSGAVDVERLPAGPLPPEDTVRVEVPLDEAPRRGAERPLVVIVQFSDFECPFCAQAHRTLEQLRAAYPSSVQVVFRHMPLPTHRHAMPAAEAAEHARAKGGDTAFWRMHDLMFEHQRSLDRAALERYAARAGLEPAGLRQALEERTYRGRVMLDQMAAASLGVRGTPAQFVNGRPMMGALPYEELDRVVREELALARKLMRDGVPREHLYAHLMEKAKTAPPAGRGPAGARLPPDAIFHVPVGDSPARGPEDALVTMVEFGDFECRYCARVQPTLEALRERYASELRIVWKNLPLYFHRHARRAHAAALEARVQGGDAAFWRMHDQLYAQQELGTAALERYAQELGLDVSRFRRALRDDLHERAIEADEILAERLEVNGTPTFFINGVRVSGAKPLDVFTETIDRALAGAREVVSGGVRRRDVYERVIADGVRDVEAVRQGLGGRREEPVGGPRISVRHILVQYAGAERAPAAITRTRREALSRAREALARARDPKADFAMLAERYGDGPAARHGGNLGEITHDMVQEDFAKAAFGLAVDDVSDVVETPFGFHVIQRYR